MKNSFYKKAFTLIELIMVIVIIGVLASIAIPKVINLRRDAQKATCFGNAGAIQAGLYGYYVRQSMSGEPHFPRDLNETNFADYITEGQLPEHPLSWNWNTYYTTTQNATVYNFDIGKYADDGACTGF